MTTDNGRAFNEWLRAQLKAKKMSQRQLAQQSGVDHSTISRLIRGDRMPSLGTATKLARGLREIRDDADTRAALSVVSMGPQNPTARVEYALRADEALTEPQVRQIMEYYLAVRVRRFARTYSTRRCRRTRHRRQRHHGSPPEPYGRAVGMAGTRVGAPHRRSAPPRRSATPHRDPRCVRPGRRVDPRQLSRALTRTSLLGPGLGDSERRPAGAGVRDSAGVPVTSVGVAPSSAPSPSGADRRSPCRSRRVSSRGVRAPVA